MAESDLQASTSSSTVLNIEDQQVGTLYANALIGATDAAGNTAQVLGELDAIVKEVLDVYPDANKLFTSIVISHEDSVGILDRLFSGKITPLLLNFLKVLSSHGRLGQVRAVQRAAREMYDTKLGRVHVLVETAHPLDGAATVEITNQLRSMLSSEPVLDLKVNPELIGGIIVRVGDTVYDGSVATQLKQLRHKIIDRSVHEIQSGRNRFSTSEGN